MSNVKTSILELVGRTPLLQVKQYQEKYNLEGAVALTIKKS